jgi:hypothetical protein
MTYPLHFHHALPVGLAETALNSQIQRRNAREDGLPMEEEQQLQLEVLAL